MQKEYLVLNGKYEFHNGYQKLPGYFWFQMHFFVAEIFFFRFALLVRHLFMFPVRLRIAPGLVSSEEFDLILTKC